MSRNCIYGRGDLRMVGYCGILTLIIMGLVGLGVLLVMCVGSIWIAI